MGLDYLDNYFRTTLNQPLTSTEKSNINRLQVNRNFLSRELRSLITPGSAPELFQTLERANPTWLSDFYTNYKIPVFATNLLENIQYNGPSITYEVRPDNDPIFFSGGAPLHAVSSPLEHKVIIRQGTMDYSHRILTWLTGSSGSTCAYEEEVIEHEVRHVLFGEYMDYDVRMVADRLGLQEAFALSSTWGYRFEDIPLMAAFIDRLPPSEADDRFHYQSLFALARLNQVDESKLIAQMSDTSLWGRVIEHDHGSYVEIQTNKRQVLQGSLNWLGIHTTDPLEYLEGNKDLKQYKDKLQRDLGRWRLKVSQYVFDFLHDQDPKFSQRWREECYFSEDE